MCKGVWARECLVNNFGKSVYYVLLHVYYKCSCHYYFIIIPAGHWYNIRLKRGLQTLSSYEEELMVKRVAPCIENVILLL